MLKKSLFINRKSLFKKIFFWRGYSRRNKTVTALFVIVLAIFSSIFIWNAIHPESSEASWFNTDWAFRKAINITAHTSAESNVYLLLSSTNALDTSDTTRFQNDCGDLRFTDVSGKLLPYYIVSGCGSSSTVVHVLMKDFPAGAQTVYYYYGNPSASNGFSNSDFPTAASGVTIGSLGSEENGPAPISYWNFDDGTGTTANDSGSIRANGTLTGASLPTWKDSNFCISAKCLYFSGGTSGSVTVARSVPNVETVSFWVNPASASAALIDLSSVDPAITATNGVISATNFASPSIYVNATSSANLTPNQWNFVTVTTSTPINASSIKIGNVKGNYLNGYIDDVKVYNYVRSTSQIQSDYNSRGSNNAGGNVLGAFSNPFMSNGLLAYWRMDESAVNVCAGGVNDSCDSSGNGFDGAWTGNASATAGGKFGNSTIYDGTGDYTTVADNAALRLKIFTIAGWFKYTSLRPSPNIINKETNSTNRNYVVFVDQTTGHVVGSTSFSGVQSDLSSTVNINDGQWHHFAYTVDGGSQKIYIDGVLSGSATNAGTADTQAQNITIGDNLTHTNTLDWDGQLDDMRIYNRALSVTDVKNLYNWTPGLGAIAYYNFEEGQGSSVKDTSGNNSIGTWQGTLGSQWTQGKYGKGGNFNGSNNYVSVAGTIGSINSVSFWVNPTSGTANLLDLDGGTHYISSSGGVVSATGFNTPVIYVNGVVNGTLNANTWNYVSVTTVISISGSAVTLGKANGSLLSGKMDDVIMYNYAQTQKQIVSDMNAFHPNVGSPVGSAFVNWTLDEGSGTLLNNLGNDGPAGNALAVNMSSPATTVSGWAQDGRVGKALSFDGVNDYVETGDLFYSDSFTLCAWINSGSNDANPRSILVKRNSTGTSTTGNANNEWAFGELSGKLFYQSWSSPGSSTDINLSGSSTLKTNTWYHVCAVQGGNGNSDYIYINGQQDATGVQSAATQDTASHIQIGTATAGDVNRFWNGKIDEVKIYNYALTPDEVKLEMNQGKSLAFGSLSDTSGLIGGSVASNSASAEYCIPGDTSTCNGPVGRWDFEEGLGASFSDSSGYDNNSAVFSSGLSWKNGKIGGGLGFNGTSGAWGQVTSGSSNNLNVTGSNVTVEAWVKPGVTSQTGFARILAKDVGSNITYGLSYDTTGTKMRFLVRTSSLLTTTGSINITDPTKWYFLVGTYDGSNIKLYVNGVQDGTSTVQTGSIASSGSTFDFGGDSGTFNFNGIMDHVMVFNYTRSQSQIGWDYNRGAPVGYWDMDECQGTVIHDMSGNGNDGTKSGSSTTGTCSTASSFWGGASGNSTTNAGKYNFAPTFNGTDDNIAVSDVSYLNSVSRYTISAWMKKAANGSNVVISKGSVASSLVSIAFWNDGVVYFINSNGVYAAGAYTFSDTNWHHFVEVYDGTQTGNVNRLKGYIDGNLLSLNFGATTIPATTPGSGQVLNFGNYVSGGKTTGQIDDVRIYNYPLTSSQVRNVYNQNSAVRFGPLTGSP